MGTIFLVLLTVVYILTCLFLVGVVLMQEGKGGGISGMITGSSPLSDSFGAQGAEQTLRKWTKSAAITFMALAILLTLIGQRFLTPSSSLPSKLSDTAPVSETAPAPAGSVEKPAQAPAEKPAAVPAGEAKPAPAQAPAAGSQQAPVKLPTEPTQE